MHGKCMVSTPTISTCFTCPTLSNTTYHYQVEQVEAKIKQISKKKQEESRREVTCYTPLRYFASLLY